VQGLKPNSLVEVYAYARRKWHTASCVAYVPCAYGNDFMNEWNDKRCRYSSNADIVRPV